ncbi:Asp-tRNA(Asn)/Glu-tRNA(Gln) amidotransferase subunit GatC [Aerococcaceae bacterium NML191292]|nr:Asp-tRNA(Asn)/Glu-tRNA(Gln) amidotransferase subunit GatC [Aerococcaceae bacterium NML210727]MCW6655197.1 Asp-tRNA(Asn)/Glu-tRNA(Gln) amidotransferase subunit GatC [Aerococcaceae bacterium NML201296]MCW6659655.1 Asp-tRNA(Asn)/Glu-tRNA(Gln) amidotransferase subunit GatC [Aerococcaceae bacterium NML191292]MCW6661344.1 Asp-tRNA(Asn)/Glu-tRNA(Gln) amidotransferase subunit GatC [Aerococcaceae bacterium NML201209]MCW6663193.1 Asp-tRNA(Asn)/Glu-tRNA(Gln) amidotransferase subunit GatC [Aerococcaceae
MITRDDIQHVAKLAKLQFKDETLDAFTAEFNSIIELVEHLEEVDTTGVEPTYHGNQLLNVFREDVAQPGVERELLLANAKTTKDGFIQVPAIIESEEA